MLKSLALLLLFFSGCTTPPENRGEVTTHGDKFVWSNSGRAFVPNYVMVDVLYNRSPGEGKRLAGVTEADVDAFVEEFLGRHGFNGVHVPVYGQWYHIGDNEVRAADREPDPRTFEVLTMIIRKVYRAGGATHLWVWGDDARGWTSAGLPGGIMGAEERYLMDQIHERLGPLPGWSMGYGFDLWEWVSREQLTAWHDYLWAKEGWNHLLGARASKNELNQISDALDYSSYEYHKPSYAELRRMIARRPDKPSFSEDRYRMRVPTKYPEKDYDEAETRRGLWAHTMAGGVAAIWGKLIGGDGTYENAEALRCFGTFWNERSRFTKGMRADSTLSAAWALYDDERWVFYQEETGRIDYRFSGPPRRVVAVDTRRAYEEIEVAGVQEGGAHTFRAPYVSDWALAVE
ncbi:MAG: hypothetical protein WBA12_01385 [Catalinimonas sp.]